MVDQIINKLMKLSLPMKYRIRPSFGEADTVLSFHFFSRRDLLHGDGIGRFKGRRLQVDIFSKIPDTEILQQRIKNEIESNQYKFVTSDSDEEVLQGVRLYHDFLIFNCLEGNNE